MLIFGWCGWYVLFSLYPTMEISWYAYIPATFLIMGMVMTEVLDRINKDNPRKLVNIYMVIKLSKLVITMVLVLVYFMLLKDNIKLILLVLAFYYIIYLLLEIYTFYITEQKLKENK
jgi:hypothetical protein